MKTIISVLVFCFLFASISHSKTCEKYDRSGNKIYYACPDSSERRFSYKWDVTTTTQDNRIIKKDIVVSPSVHVMAKDQLNTAVVGDRHRKISAINAVAWAMMQKNR